MNTSKYTFLLPAFKTPFLEEALLSIKNQTFKDFVVLVSDDCSPEPIKQIFDKVVGDDSRFSYCRNEENMGAKSLVSHWNLLVDMCDTEYLIMASDDDVYFPNFLEEANKLFVKYPETNILRGRSRVINSKGEMIREEKQTQEWIDHLHYIHRLYQLDYAGGIASYIYRTHTLKTKGMFPDWPLAWFSDEAGNIMMAEQGCCITPKVTFEVRSSDFNISSKWGDSVDSRKKIIATYVFYSWMKSYIFRIGFQIHDHNLLQLVTSEYKKKVRNNIQNYIYHVPPLVFLKFIISLPQGLGLCRLRMFVHYIHGKLMQYR